MFQLQIPEDEYNKIRGLTTAAEADIIVAKDVLRAAEADMETAVDTEARLVMDTVLSTVNDWQATDFAPMVFLEPSADIHYVWQSDLTYGHPYFGVVAVHYPKFAAVVWVEQPQFITVRLSFENIEHAADTANVYGWNVDFTVIQLEIARHQEELTRLENAANSLG